MKRLIRHISFLIISLVVASDVCAQDGSSAYNFLNITSSARIYGLGGVNITTVDADNISTTDQNPALLGPEMSHQLSFNYMNYIGGSNFAGLRFAHAAGDMAAWSAAIQYFGYGSIKSADETGMITGSFSPKDVAFTGAYSHDLTSRLRGGIAVKMLYSSYEQYSAFAMATDLGLNYYDEEREMSLSLVVANLGGQIKRFTDRYDRLPIDVRLGWAQKLGQTPLRLSITAWNLTKWHLPYVDLGNGVLQEEPVLKDKFMPNLFRHLVFGLDLVPNDKFYIGVGYNYKTRTDMSTYQRNFLSGFSIGAGLKVRQFSFGLALSQPHTGAMALMLNLSTNLYEF